MKIRKIILLMSLAVAAATIQAQAEEAPSLLVTTLTDVVNASDGLISLREAIAYSAANPSLGSNITFNAGLAGGTCVLSLGQLVVNHGLIITGPGAALLTIDAHSASRVFHVSGSETVAKVSGLTITGGKINDGHGGGIFNDARSLTLQDVKVIQNSIANTIRWGYAYGGGIYSASGSLTLTDVELASNVASAVYQALGGGLYIESGDSTLTNVRVVENSVEASNSSAIACGGGIYKNSGTLLLTNVEVDKNSAFASDATYPVTCNGGGIYNGSGALTLADVTLTGNSASTFAPRSPAHGGGLYNNAGAITLSRTEIRENIASTLSSESHARGGGLYNAAGEITLSGMKISGNTAATTASWSSAYGGGVYNDSGTVRLMDLEVCGNMLSAPGNACTEIGGGVYSQTGTLILANSVVYDNSSKNLAGGIYIQGTATLNNTTISGNSLQGVYIHTDADVMLANTIVAMNEGDDIVGVFTGGNNLINMDPLFVDSENGDYRIQIGSFAINGGNDSRALDVYGNPLTTDKDGQPRIAGGRVDIGSYEYQGDISLRETPSCVVTTLLDDTNAMDGLISLREAIFYAANDATMDRILFDESLDGGTIVLAGSQVQISGSCVIDASALSSLTIDADGRSRVMHITGLSTDVSIIGLTLTGGHVTGPGGGIYNLSGSLRLERSVVRGNSAFVFGDRSASCGGGVYNGTGALQLTDSEVSGNLSSASGYATRSSGGGIYNDSGIMTMTNVVVSENAANSGGAGGARTDSFGGGIYNQSGRLSLMAADISRNSLSSQNGHGSAGGPATSYGGGIYNNSGELSLNRVEVNGNTHEGIYVLGTVQLTASKVSGNLSHGLYVHSNGAASLANVEVCGNASLGVYILGTAILTNSTISGNASHGVYVEAGGTGTLANTLVTFNMGRGVSVHAAGAATLNHTMVTLNASGAIEGTFTGEDNLVGDIDPLFIDADNGDYRLQAGSFAVNGGADELAVDADGNPLTTDKNGQPRIAGGRVDIGAHEYQGDAVVNETPSCVVTTLLDVTNAMDGLISLREAIFYAANDATMDRILFDESLGGGTIVLTGSQIQISDSCIIDASALSSLTIDADGQSRVMYITGLSTDVSITGLTFTGGVCTANGGGIFNGAGRLSLVSVKISGSSASGSGGGIYSVSGTLNLMNMDVSGNTASGTGGGIYNEAGTLTLHRMTINENSASNGGGIYNDRGLVTLSDVEINRNSALNGYGGSAYGGGIYNNSGAMTMTDVSINENSVSNYSWYWTSFGGGVYNHTGVLTMRDVVVSGNAVNGWYRSFGGGVYSNSGALTLENSAVTGNSPEGVYVRGTAVLASTVIRGNASHGLYVYSDGAASLANVEVSGNASHGVYILGTANLVNATISGNASHGVYVEAGGAATLANTLVALNKGRGISVHAAGAATLNHTMVSLNANGAIAGTFTGNDNLVGDIDPLFIDIGSGDFRLKAGSLAVNGGADELAVDADGNPLTTDKSGQPRIAGGRVDMGAYEYQGNAVIKEVPSRVVTTLLDVLDATDGLISLREAIFYATNDATMGRVLFDESLDGGTIVLAGSQVQISGSCVIDASALSSLTIDADGQGRIMYITGLSTDVSIIGLTLTGGVCTANGGGIFNEAGTLSLVGVEISGNTASGSGGGIYSVSGSLNLMSSTVRANSALHGGGLFKESGDLSLADVAVCNNLVSGSGGGIYNNSGKLSVNQAAVSENTHEGVYVRGTAILASTVIRGNTSHGLYVYSDGAASLANVEVSGNASHGVYILGTANLVNATVSGNASHGVYVEAGSAATLANTLVALNMGNGVHVATAGAATLTNTMVTFNEQGTETLGLFAGNHNLIGGLNPLFVDAANGDFRLKAGSYAVGYGANALAVNAAGNPLTTDKDGQPRIVGGQVDIGAYEYHGGTVVKETPSRVVTTLLDLDDATDSLISLREAIFHATNSEGGDTVTFDESLGGGTLVLAGYPIQVFDTCNIDASALSSLTIDANKRSRGLYIRGQNSHVSMVGLTIQRGYVSGSGGGIYNYDSALTLSNITITANSSVDGGGIYNYSGLLTLSDVRIVGNSVSGCGGGICNLSGMLTLNSVEVRGNSGSIINSWHMNCHGGGIYNDSGIMSLRDVDIMDNSVFASGFHVSSHGGGIYDNSGSATMVNVKISRNSACAAADGGSWSLGGGIYNGSADLKLMNVVISKNSATASGYASGFAGGGIYGGAGSLTLINATVSGNASQGVYLQPSVTAMLANTIVSLNVGNDIAGSFTGSHNLVGIDPLFVNAVAGDYRLTDKSAAINAGDSVLAVDSPGNPLVFDLAGNARISGASVDIGAYEFLGLPEALDNTGLVWTTGGAVPWDGQTRVTRDGTDAAGSGLVNNNAQSWLATSVTTGGTLTFVWRVSSLEQNDLLRFEVDGQTRGLISGETEWRTVTVSVPYGEHTFRWVYAKGTIGTSGADCGWVDKVVWVPLPPLTLAMALNTHNLVWQTEGDATWFPQTDISADGFAAAQSGMAGDAGWSCLKTQVTGSGVLTFDWAVSCRTHYDWLLFIVDGVIQRAVTGETAWQRIQLTLGEGDHELRWEYWEDDSPARGGGAGWLDRVSWSGDMPAAAGFTLWLAEHELGGEPTARFAEDSNGDGVPNGFDYAFGTNRTDGLPLLTIRIVNGRPVVETPVQDAATLPYVNLRVLSSADLVHWAPMVNLAADTTGMPANRLWYEPAGPPLQQAFFKLEAELK